VLLLAVPWDIYFYCATGSRFRHFDYDVSTTTTQPTGCRAGTKKRRRVEGPCRWTWHQCWPLRGYEKMAK